jgi:hypothetical protein
MEMKFLPSTVKHQERCNIVGLEFFIKMHKYIFNLEIASDKPKLRGILSNN